MNFNLYKNILQRIIRTIAISYLVITQGWNRLIMYVLSSLFISFGKKASFAPLKTIIKGYRNISIGNGSTIGPGTTIYTTKSKLIIGNKTGIGPNCILITGNHSLHIIGKFYKDYLDSD